MSHISFLNDRGVKAAVTPDGGLNLKGLSDLSTDTRQEVLTFARDNKQAIISELETPPPDLSRIKPDDRAEYSSLWYKAWKLAGYVDDSSAAPYEKRMEKMPELNRLNARMTEIEDKLTAAPEKKEISPENTREYWDSMIRCQVGQKTIQHQMPQADEHMQCFSCKGSSFWRKNEPGAKWICLRCHQPAAGLDVFFEQNPKKKPKLSRT